jgi:hypothetical protein
MAPLLTPAPGLGRSVRLDPPAGFGVAGETAASPGGVFEPVLAFCACAKGLAKISAAPAAIHAFFIAVSSLVSGWSRLCRPCVSAQVGITP